MPTTIEDFDEFFLFRPGQHPDRPLEFAAPLWVARQRVASHGWSLVEGTCAFALPAGKAVRTAYEALRDEIIGQLRDAMPVDAVALGMHGAMVADGYDDCEGDMVERIRELVGPDVAIGMELDPHCHLTDKMRLNSDVIVIFKAYPHTDYVERAEDLLDLLQLTVSGAIKPVMSVFDCRMIDTFHTTYGPMKQFVADILDLEGKNGVQSISVVHGFPWGDVPDMGTKILVITDDAAGDGERLARELGERLFANRGRMACPKIGIEDGLNQVLTGAARPVVFADCADNPGGGAPGDATFLLSTLLDQNIQNACLAPLWDPVAVRTCFSAGCDAVQPLRFGGKMGPSSGAPIDGTVRVKALYKDMSQTFSSSKIHLGDCAAVRLGGIDIVLTSLRAQALGLDIFTQLGIQPVEYSVVVVKSSQHFHDAFAPISEEVLYIDGPGALVQDLSQLEYVKLEREIWPLVE